MRLTCDQCGNSIFSEICSRFCDQSKRHKQFQEAEAEEKKVIEQFKKELNK